MTPWDSAKLFLGAEESAALSKIGQVDASVRARNKRTHSNVFSTRCDFDPAFGEADQEGDGAAESRDKTQTALSWGGVYLTDLQPPRESAALAE